MRVIVHTEQRKREKRNLPEKVLTEFADVFRNSKLKTPAQHAANMPSIFGEDLFDDFMGYPTGRQAAANAYPQVKDMMKTDIRDVDGNYELEIDLPGFKKEDVKIQLKNGYLNIQATREEKKDEKDDKGKYVRRERYTGTCNRSFYVGSSIKHEDIHAKYENGILHVTFPKEETKKEAEEKKFVSID